MTFEYSPRESAGYAVASEDAPHRDRLVSALTVLREAALGAYRIDPKVREAINALDNADAFTAIDDLDY